MTSTGDDIGRIVAQLEATRAEEASGVKRTAIISLIVGGVIGAGVAIYLQNPIGLVAAPVAAIIGGLIAHSMAASRWSHSFKHLFVAAVARKHGLEYEPNAGIEESEFMATDLFNQEPDRYSTEDLMHGAHDKTKLKCAEIHAEYKTESVDSKGNRTTHWHTIFRGRMFVFDFNKHFNGVTLVLPDREASWLGGFGETLQKWAGKLGLAKGELVKLEDPEFEKLFKVYSTDQVEARYILTPSLMRRILDFRQALKSDVHCAFFGANLYVAVSSKQDYFEAPSLYQPLEHSLSPEKVHEHEFDVRFALDLADQLNLNTRIWSKQ